jgi:hypothetical protein
LSSLFALAWPHIERRHAQECNCRVVIYRDTQVLLAGHPVDKTSQRLQGKLAFFVEPRRDWERAAALEGVYYGRIKVVSKEVNLQGATRVVISNHDLAGEYVVTGASSTFGRMWTLELGRRAVNNA